MTAFDKQSILQKVKEFFNDTIAVNHVKNTKKLGNLNEFIVNPFLNVYLANFAFGSSDPVDVAKALIYPRVLGTSITTSFGTNMQNFCSVVLSGYASLIPGIDIEFIDATDNRRKYCQIKAGPNTINKDDIITIQNHFDAVKNLARTNRQTEINPTIDCIVGVLYGSENNLSAHYKKIQKNYPVICGNDFWFRLTGDDSFYNELIDAFAEVAVDIDGREIIEEAITKLAEEIEETYNV